MLDSKKKKNLSNVEFFAMFVFDKLIYYQWRIQQFRTTGHGSVHGWGGGKAVYAGPVTKT